MVNIGFPELFKCRLTSYSKIRLVRQKFSGVDAIQLDSLFKTRS